MIKMNIIFHKAKMILFLLFWLLLICNCRQQERDFSITTIEVDVQSNAVMKLSCFFENFRMVRLESDVVIGEIRKIRYENNMIYIVDNMNTLFIFSDSGELLSNFNHNGGGPCEYVGITDFVVNDDTITVLDRTSQKLLKYDDSGICFSVHDLGYWAWAVSPTVNQYYFLYCGNVYDEHNQISKLRRVWSGQPDSMYIPVDPNQAKFLNFRIRDNFFRSQDTIYFFELFNDIVYSSVGGGSIQPTYYISYMGRNIPASFFERNYANVAEFLQEYNKTSYARGVFNFVAFDSFLMFVCYDRQKIKWTVFDRKDGISYTFSDFNDDVYFSGLTVPASTIGYFADKHIFVPIDAYKIVEWRNEHQPAEQFKEMINATNEDDNPILLIFNFKQ